MDRFLHDRDLRHEREKTEFMVDLEQVFLNPKRIIVKLFFLLTYQVNKFSNHGYTLKNLPKDQRATSIFFIFIFFLAIVFKVIFCMKYSVAFK